MKKIKGLIILVFAVFLVVATLPTLPLRAAEIRYGRTVISQMNKKESLLHLYDKLVESCKKNNPENIEINTKNHQLTSEDFISLYHIFLADYPEYFWLDGSCGYGNEAGSGFVCSVMPGYSVKGSSLTNAKAAFEKKVNELTKGLSGKSEYEKSLILHDRLAETTEYVITNNDQNAYGALVEGRAVCAGYSKAYQHLLHKQGIPAWCVTGESINPATNLPEGHEWNLVSIDGKWYYTDVTWDDQDDYLFYAYFNITTKQMEENHTVTEFQEYLPNATATDANYFYKNNLVYSSPDLDRIAKQLKDDNYRTRIYVNGNKQGFINSLSVNIGLLMQKMNIPAGWQCSYSTISVGNEIDFYVTLIEPNHQHSLTPVAAKPSTCTSKGNMAYYTCNCGKWFTDANASNEILDKQSVETAAVPHVASAWNKDNINHWKNCSKCGVEMPNTMNHHTDGDSNSKCDVCSYNLPKDQIAAAPTPTQKPQGNSNNVSSNQSAVTESVPQNNSSQESVSQEEVPLENEEAKTEIPVPNKKKLITTIGIAASSLIILGGAGTGLFFIIKHK